MWGFFLLGFWDNSIYANGKFLVIYLINFRVEKKRYDIMWLLKLELGSLKEYVMIFFKGLGSY